MILQRETDVIIHQISCTNNEIEVLDDRIACLDKAKQQAWSNRSEKLVKRGELYMELKEVLGVR